MALTLALSLALTMALALALALALSLTTIRRATAPFAASGSRELARASPCHQGNFVLRRFSRHMENIMPQPNGNQVNRPVPRERFTSSRAPPFATGETLFYVDSGANEDK